MHLPDLRKISAIKCEFLLWWNLISYFCSVSLSTLLSFAPPPPLSLYISFDGRESVSERSFVRFHVILFSFRLHNKSKSTKTRTFIWRIKKSWSSRWIWMHWQQQQRQLRRRKNEERNLSKFHINFNIHCKTAELLSWKKQPSRVESVWFRFVFVFGSSNFSSWFSSRIHFISFHVICLFARSLIRSFVCMHSNDNIGRVFQEPRQCFVVVVVNLCCIVAAVVAVAAAAAAAVAIL